MFNIFSNKKHLIPEIMLFLVIVVSGLLFVNYTRNRFEKEKAENVLQIARSVAAALPQYDLNALEGKPGDIDMAQYQRIKSTLKLVIHVNKKARFAYLLITRNNKLYFLADSESEESKDYSPPGQEYTEAQAADRQLFIDGKEVMTSPQTDRWGTWVSAMIPVRDRNSGKIIAVFGMDFDWTSWNMFILYEVIESTVLCLLLIIAIYTIINILKKNKILNKDIIERKLATEALKESEEKYRLIFEYSPLGLLSFNEKGILVACNEFFAKIIGTPVSDLIGLNLLGLPDKKLVTAIQKALDGSNGYYEDSYRSITANKVSMARAIFAPVKSADGSFRGGAGIIEDITEQKKAQDALRESEEKYRTIFENVQDVFYQTNLLGTILEISPSVKYFSEFQRDDLIGTAVHDLYFNPGDRDLLLNEISKNGELRDYELKLISKSGIIKNVSINATLIFSADGKPHHIDGAIRDISERKRVDGALRKSEERQHFILESLPVAIFTSPDNKAIDTTWISGNIKKITGFEVEEYLSANDFWRSRLHLEDSERVLNAVLNIPDSRETIVEYRWKCKDEQYHWFQNRSVLLENESGKEYLGVIVDITEIRNAQEEIRQLNLELEQRVKQRTLQLENTNKELEAFSYSISHDLRAPLRGIDGWSFALLEDYNHLLDEKGRLYLERVRSESQRMGNLIDDLLKLSRVNRAQMKKAEVHISDIVNIVIGRLHESHPGRQCEFEVQPDLLAHGDPKMLEIAITNLLDNACKFTSSNPLAKIEFGQQIIDNVPTFYLRDNGVGFNMEFSKKLFGAFQRMHKQADFPGSGIGLATVKRIVSRHGGRVWAESKPGEGAKFYFTLA